MIAWIRPKWLLKNHSIIISDFFFFTEFLEWGKIGGKQIGKNIGQKTIFHCTGEGKVKEEKMRVERCTLDNQNFSIQIRENVKGRWRMPYTSYNNFPTTMEDKLIILSFIITFTTFLLPPFSFPPTLLPPFSLQFKQKGEQSFSRLMLCSCLFLSSTLFPLPKKLGESTPSLLGDYT